MPPGGLQRGLPPSLCRGVDLLLLLPPPLVPAIRESVTCVSSSTIKVEEVAFTAGVVVGGVVFLETTGSLFMGEDGLALSSPLTLLA